MASVAAVAAVFAFSGSSANAGAAYSADADGVDYDAACLVALPTPPPAKDSIASPGAPGGSLGVPPGGSGCNGVSIYDGSTQATDLQNTTATNTCVAVPIPPTGGSLGMASQPTVTSPSANKAFCGNWNVGALSVPAPGSTTTPPPDGTAATLDTPHSTFGGAQYFTMYQNKTVQTNVPTNNTHGGGCTRVGTSTPVYDQHESWKDGFHFWISYGIHWDGTNWVHSVKVGTYDPSPTGGFGFFEIGYNDGGGWVNSNPHMIKGINWDANLVSSGTGTQIYAWTDGIVATPDTTNCQQGFFNNVFGKPGDVIANGKALTTADQVFVLPVAIPLSLLCGATGGAVCESDLKSVGGFVFFSDVTGGNSTAGAANTNIANLAYTGGAIGISDTLGPRESCPTPTFGGLLPTNPLFTPDTACHIDDDPVSRGSFLSEWWDTPLGFTF